MIVGKKLAPKGFSAKASGKRSAISKRSGIARKHSFVAFYATIIIAWQGLPEFIKGEELMKKSLMANAEVMANAEAISNVEAMANTEAPRSGGRHFTVFYSKGEEIFNAVSHIVGGAIGIAALVLGLIFAYPSAKNMIAVTVFAVSVIVLYTMSALYHFLRSGKAKAVFRIFDHCTIFLLIAGTYTPFCLIALNGSPLGIGILVAEWIMAVLGITGNAIAMNNKVIKGFSMAFYCIMGWLILIAFGQLVKMMPPTSFYLLLFGGIAYTVGIAFFAFGKKVKYFHSVWHLFDIAGTVLQFASILLLLL